MGEEGGAAIEEEELEIVEVVRHKLVFSGRPEPVGGGTEER
jgi:chromosome transmission fidelity protein 8